WRFGEIVNADLVGLGFHQPVSHRDRTANSCCCEVASNTGKGSVTVGRAGVSKKETQAVCLRFAFGAPRQCRWTLILNRTTVQGGRFPVTSGSSGSFQERGRAQQ